MNSTSAAVDPALGEGLQRLRNERGLSLRTLAAAAGFSPSFLSQVENGQASPSIASLERLTGVLGVSMAEFFRALSAGSGLVLRASERRRFTSEWSQARIEPLLPAPGALLSLEGVIVTIEPGGRSGREPVMRAHEQLALVLDGEITLSLARTASHVLRPGDAAAIPANCAHSWENTGSADARIVIVAARAPAPDPPAPRPRQRGKAGAAVPIAPR